MELFVHSIKIGVIMLSLRVYIRKEGKKEKNKNKKGKRFAQNSTINIDIKLNT